MQNRITTERLDLDPLTEDDHRFMLELVNTPGWLEFIGNRNVSSEGEAIAYIRMIRGIPEYTYWVVRVKGETSPIGVITFLKREYLDHHDLGFAFLPQHMGKGLAYEAAKAVLNLVGQEHTNVLATCMPNNLKSIGLLEKLGFRFEREIEEGGQTLLVYSTSPENKSS